MLWTVAATVALLLPAPIRSPPYRAPTIVACAENNAVWSTIQEQAAAASTDVMAPYLSAVVTSQPTLPEGLALCLAQKLASDGSIPVDALASKLASLLGEPDVCAAVTADLTKVVAFDPAAPDLLAVFLNFKGFLALSTHRCAHALWSSQTSYADKQLALLLQGRASECFGVDIHPAATIGRGVFIDHATGIVFGEQSEVGDDCYILHGVTLGATGKKDKKTGRRHPIIGSGVTIGSMASVLGPITVGDGATVGACATVTKSVEPGASVIDTGYMSNKVLRPKKPKAAAEKGIEIEVLGVEKVDTTDR